MTTHISKMSCDHSSGCRKATNVESTVGWVHIQGTRQRDDRVVEVVHVDYCPDHASQFNDLDWNRL